MSSFAVSGTTASAARAIPVYNACQRAVPGVPVKKRVAVCGLNAHVSFFVPLFLMRDWVFLACLQPCERVLSLLEAGSEFRAVWIYHKMAFFQSVDSFWWQRWCSFPRRIVQGGQWVLPFSSSKIVLHGENLVRIQWPWSGPVYACYTTFFVQTVLPCLLNKPSPIHLFLMRDWYTFRAMRVGFIILGSRLGILGCVNPPYRGIYQSVDSFWGRRWMMPISTEKYKWLT